MTKKKHPAEFPVTIDEFLGELHPSKVEMKAGFLNACTKAAITGHKTRAQWHALLTQYNSLPVDAPIRQKGGK